MPDKIEEGHILSIKPEDRVVWQAQNLGETGELTIIVDANFALETYSNKALEEAQSRLQKEGAKYLEEKLGAQIATPYTFHGYSAFITSISLNTRGLELNLCALSTLIADTQSIIESAISSNKPLKYRSSNLLYSKTRDNEVIAFTSLFERWVNKTCKEIPPYSQAK